MDEKQYSPAILPAKSDVVFKKLFGDVRNKEELISLLKAMLHLPEDDYKLIEIDNTHLLPEYAGDKYAILDIRLHTKSRKVIHIEIQLRITQDLKSRLMFYGSKLITEQLGAGEKYAEINPVISIIITDKTLIEGSPKYHHRFTFYDQEAKVEFSDLMAIHTLETNKRPKAPDGSQLYDWASFIAATSEEELNVVAKRNPQIAKAVVKLRELSADEQTRDLYERREKARRDEASQMYQARQEGRQEGETTKAFEVAKNLLRMNLSIDQVAAATGLTREEVESLMQ